MILASASPRRADLLAAAGFAFDVVRVDVDEGILPAERAHDYVSRLADAKSLAASRPDLSARPILAADTAVVIDGRILGKPADDSQAADMLRLLSGRWHEVLTGVAVRLGDRRVRAVESTVVRFVEMSADDIRWYVGTGEPRGKAGGYGVQGLGARFIDRIEGSYSNVVGLPIASVCRLLRQVASAGPVR